ncbi:MAG TPA: RluA family pseudouridine synthase [Verrucomicrobiae bacterium]|nr:RluA family pseudouridine synthase [Verrucomicrobiae bacterium]
MSAAIKLSSPATREFWEIAVLFEDDSLLALDKPARLATSPERANPERPSLANLLHEAINAGKSWAKERGLNYLMNLYRLDAEASGVILFAKTKSVQTTLADLFGSEKPLKKYLALVRGVPADDQFEINQKIAPHPVVAGMMRVDSRNGKRSRTLVQTRERFSNYALLECRPATDRPHQIRVHLSHIGLPVVGDSLYGGRPLFLSRLKKNYQEKKDQPERPLMGRAALHAEQLEIPHPISGEPLHISAPWPKDLKAAVKYLGQFGK